MSKIFLLVGTALGGLAVAIGAFGAHALKLVLEANDRISAFDTGVKYQFFHSLALLILGLIMIKYDNKMFVWAGYAFITGIVLFSGSLYTLSLASIGKWGIITPIGGLALVSGWIFLFIGIAKAIN